MISNIDNTITNNNINERFGDFVGVINPPSNIDTIIFDIGGILSFEDPNFQLRLGNWAITHENDGSIPHGVLLYEFISWLLEAWKTLHYYGEHFPLHVAKREFTRFMPCKCAPTLINEFFEFMGASRLTSEWGITLLDTLKSRGYKLYYLSDICQYNMEIQRNSKSNNSFNHMFNELFDGGVFSYEIPWRKPDPRIYKLLIDKYEINPETSAFFDDQPKNAEVAALEFGFWSKVVKPSIHEMEGLAILLDETAFPDLTKIKGKEERLCHHSNASALDMSK